MVASPSDLSEAPGRTNWAPYVVGLGAALFLGLAVVFRVWSVGHPSSFPRFVLAVGVLFTLPGAFLLRLGRLEVSPLERITLATVLGMVLAGAVHVLAIWGGEPRAFYGLGVLSVAGAWLSWPGLAAGARRLRTSLDRSHAALLVAFAVAWVPLFVLPYYVRSLARAGEGTMTIVQFPDAQLHASIAAELSHTVPPEVPFVAGERLSYHVGMDVVPALLHRHGGVPLPDLVVRYGPTLTLLLTLLAAFCLARRLMGSGTAAAVAAFLVLLGEDLSFLHGLSHPEALWCADFFLAPSVFSQYAHNPMGLANGLVFAALFCVCRSLEDRRPGWVVATALCAAPLLQVKVFAFAHLGLAVGITLLVHLVRFRRPVFLLPALAVLVASAPLVVLILNANDAGGRFLWGWSSGARPYVEHAGRQLGWAFMESAPWLGLAAYLGLTFGFRLAGLIDWLRALWPRRDRPFPMLLAVYVLVGPIVSLVTKVVPAAHPETYYNNAIWFLVESKYVATLFAVGALHRLWVRGGGLTRVGVAVGLALASLPTSIQFVVKMSELWPQAVLEADEVAVVKRLARVSAPGDVAMSPFNGTLLQLTKVRTNYHSVYLASFVREAVETARAIEVGAFWDEWKRGVFRKRVVFDQGVRWLVASPLPPPLPAELRLEYVNASYALYEVVAPPP